MAIGIVLMLCADLWLRNLRSRFVDEASARIDVTLSATLMERVLGMRLAQPARSRSGSFASQPARLRAGARLHRLAHRHRADRPAVCRCCSWSSWSGCRRGWRCRRSWRSAVIVMLGWVLQHRLHQLSETTYRACGAAQRDADRKPDRHRDHQDPGRRRRDPGQVGTHQRLPRAHQRAHARAVGARDLRHGVADAAVSA